MNSPILYPTDSVSLLLCIQQTHRGLWLWASSASAGPLDHRQAGDRQGSLRPLRSDAPMVGPSSRRPTEAHTEGFRRRGPSGAPAKCFNGTVNTLSFPAHAVVALRPREAAVARREAR